MPSKDVQTILDIVETNDEGKIVNLNPVIEKIINLSSNRFLESDEIKIVSIYLQEYITKKNIPYPIITSSVYSISSKSIEIDVFDTNFDRIVEAVCGEIDTETEKFKSKVKTHYNLACVQKSYIDKNMVDANKNSLQAKKIIEDIQDIKGKIYTDFVAIMGIFSALIFGLFGGFSAIGDIVTATFNKSINLPNIMIAISLTLGSLSLLLFALMQGIKILSKSTLKSCGCDNKTKCYHSVFQRHPVMSLNLIALSSIFIISVLVKIIPKTVFECIYVKETYLYYGLVMIGIVLIIGMIVSLNWSVNKKWRIFGEKTNKK
ncbi:hypothetical protein [Brochothrix campestris]|uniref:Uncharacterized protein n=1 Tax=Brochothrix campestris FSL F6-1037 TaxID=1265861 RepID=W7D220_9LIST|nr:hypothetical protein [Brochothrix campestris]EUJ41991.1 hypothetical protein BCAMP_01260 [Brochothrix campestris FSL F6-1037]